MPEQSTALPENYSYSREHEWIDTTAVSAAGTTVAVGITAVAADALGDVVFLEPPAVGTEVTAGEVCGEIESTKSVSELYSPVSGTVTEVNEAAVGDPSLVNSDPYGAGWLFKVQVSETGDLLDAQEYLAHAGQ